MDGLDLFLGAYYQFLHLLSKSIFSLAQLRQTHFHQRRWSGGLSHQERNATTGIGTARDLTKQDQKIRIDWGKNAAAN